MVNHKFVYFLMLLVVVLLSGCAKKGGTKGDDVEVIARVNGAEISVNELTRELYPQGPPEEPDIDTALAEAILQQLIDRALIVDWANKNKIEVTEDEIDARLDIIKADYSEGNIDKYLKQQGINLEQLRERIEGDLIVERSIAEKISSKTEATDGEIEGFYEKHKKDYVSPDEYHIKQIITDTQKEAEDAMTAIEFGTPFEQVAADKSVAPDRYAGGDVGYVPIKALPPNVADAVKNLPEGEISPIIETEYGYFLVRLEDIKEGGAIPLEEVSGEIAEKVRAEKEAKAYAEWLAQLRTAADIKIEEKLLSEL
ncbi:MAG: hypothetical protein GY771_15350 [bacterium]|nr:hypothetical protein [bacterium]